MYELTIRPALNGWIVRAGCQELIFSDREFMLNQVNEYLQQPDVVEKRYREGATNAKILLKTIEEVPLPQAEVPPPTTAPNMRSSC